MKRIYSVILCSIGLCNVYGQCYTLQQLKDSALHNNYAMRSAQYAVDAAQEQRKEAFTKFFPSVSGTGMWFNANRDMAKTTVNMSEYISADAGAALAQSLPAEALAAMGEPVSVSMMKNGIVGAVTAVQPVFVGGQLVNGNRLARVGEEVSRLQYQLSENEVGATAERYFWQLVSLQEKMKTVDAVQQMLNGVAKDADVAVRAGVAVRNDLMQVQLRQNEVESQKVELQNALSLLRLSIAQYCGLADTSFSVSVPAGSDGLPERQDHRQALYATAEYQLLDKQVEAAELQRRTTVGQNLPSVAVGAGYTYHDLLDDGRSFGLVFATVSVPLSDWWGGSHAIRRKKIEAQRAQEQLADNSELLQLRMQRAWNNVESALQHLDIARRSIEQAEENLRLNRDYYRAGTSTMSDLLQAQLLYQQACDKRSDAQSNYFLSLSEYNRSVGR